MLHINIKRESLSLAFKKTDARALAQEQNLFRRIPSQQAITTQDYHSVMVDKDGLPGKEKLEDVRCYGIRSVPYYRTQAEFCPLYQKNIREAAIVNYARTGVCDRLDKANQVLRSLGLELVVVDAHRSPTTQKALFDFFVNEAKQKGLSEQEAIQDALTYCSSADQFDPDDFTTWPMHACGGAIDCYMMDSKRGRIIDFGEGHFDCPEKSSNIDYYETKSNLTPLEQDFRDARRLFYNVMSAQGFVFFPNECGHISFGDQLWGLIKGEKALYGYCPAPVQEEASYNYQPPVSYAQRKIANYRPKK